LKNKPSKKLAFFGFFFVLFFDPEFGGRMLLRNIGSLSTDSTAWNLPLATQPLRLAA
jgi:hypothetical protein